MRRHSAAYEGNYRTSKEEMITPEQLSKSGSEHGEQSAIFCWAAINIDKYPELKWLAAIPNGGYRDKRTAGNLKAEGVKRGVPDMVLLVRRGEYAALWIELKQLKFKPKRVKSKGGVRDEQNEWLDQAQSCGHGAVVCYGWIEARDMIVRYLEWQ